MMEDMTGLKFSRLTVLGLAQNKPRLWLCLCECGNQCTRKAGILRYGSGVKSCGCAKSDSIAKASIAAWAVTTKFRHPDKLHLKWVYRNMVNRCHKPGAKSFERYGGRGISVCDKWRFDPTSFFNWAVRNGYQRGLTLDRRDNDGNYNPENCKWSTLIEQANNTRKNRFVEWNGERLTVAQWARKLNVSRVALQHRVERQWSPKRIFTHPIRRALA